MFTLVHLCLPLFTGVYLCLLVLDNLCLLGLDNLFTNVYSCLAMFTRKTYVYHSLPYVYLCLLVFTYVCHCLIVLVYLCLPIFTCVYLC